ncbi:MAG: hypothetical protein QM647_18240 [Asticcacaulis sp.]|uniref:hypothetical protein n=1 Tax=Asticcacaulis sp. TaxID=1872648 RepID=UPI0039E34FE2
MKLIYLPDQKQIVQDDVARTLVATMTPDGLDDMPTETMAKAMAVAPELVCILEGILNVKPNPDGGCTLLKSDIDSICLALWEFTPADYLALTCLVYVPY